MSAVMLNKCQPNAKVEHINVSNDDPRRDGVSGHCGSHVDGTGSNWHLFSSQLDFGDCQKGVNFFLVGTKCQEIYWTQNFSIFIPPKWPTLSLAKSRVGHFWGTSKLKRFGSKKSLGTSFREKKWVDGWVSPLPRAA